MVKSRLFKGDYFYFIFIIIFSLLLNVVWFRNGNVMGGGESGLPFHNLTRQYDIIKYSWTDVALGSSSRTLTAGTPLFRTLSILSRFIPDYILEALFLWTIFAVSGISVWFLTKELFPKLRGKFFLLSVLFYWFNPISLVNVWNRFLYNYMVFWAFLPLALFLFVRGIKKKDLRFSLMISLVTAIFSYALTSPAFFLMLWFTFIYISFFFFILEKGRRLFLMSYLLLTVLGFFLTNFWWLSQLFVFRFSDEYLAATSELFTSLGNLSTLSSLSDRLGGLVNVFRFMHGTFFIDGPGWAKIYNLPVLSGAGFLVSIIIFWAIFRFKKVKEVLLLGSLFFLSIFLVKGNTVPLGEPFQYFFLKIPALQVFRNPFEKFSFFTLVFSAPLLAIGVYDLERLWGKIRFSKFVVPAIFILIFGFWGFPFWTGLVFTSNQAVEGPKLRDYEVKPPSFYRQADEWFIRNGSDFRFVSLPIGGEAIDYNWDKPYSGVELSATLFQTPNISFNTTIPFYNDFVTELAKYQLNRQILNFFPFINAKYILWREDFDFRNRQMADPASVLSNLAAWEKDGLVEKLKDFGKIAIYEVNRRWVWPQVYISSEIYLSNSKDLSFLSDFLDFFPESKSVVVNKSFIDKKLDYKKLIYTPDKLYLQKVSVPLPKNLTDEQLLGKLFYANHLPGEWTYPFIRLNERILEIREKDYDGWMLYKTGILGKRVAEIYKLKKSGAKEALIQSSQKDYEYQLLELSDDIARLIKRGSQIEMVVRNSLIYQWELLGRAKVDSTSSLLAELLSKWDVKPTFELPPSNDTYVVVNFKLLSDGSYNLYGADKRRMFLDGGELLAEKDSLVDLKSGEHEIAMNLTDDEIYRNLLNQSEVVVDKDSPVDWSFSITEMPKTYEVDFDYRFVRGNLFGLKIVQDIENDTNASFRQDIYKDSKYHGWSHFNSEIMSANGATNASLTISSSDEKVCRKLWWGPRHCSLQDSDFEVEIKNLRVRETDLPQLALVVNGKRVSGGIPSNVAFTKINPAVYKVHIDKVGENPEILVFSELYNSSWNLEYESGEKFPKETHLLVNDYANGWVITKEGSYDLLIDFEPQNILTLGKKISIASVIAASVLLILFALRRKKHEAS